MNLKLKKLSQAILELDDGGSLESLYVNYSVASGIDRIPIAKR